MVTGIDAAITTLTDGTTARAADVMASLNSLNTNGVSNDSGAITTDNAGGLTVVKLTTTGGGTLAYFISSQSLVSNDAINSGASKTYTCTGFGGIPSGAKAVVLSYYYSSAATNTFLGFTPHGTTYSNGNYPASNPVATGSPIGNTGSFTVELDGSGKIDVAAFNGNVTGLYMSIFGYYT